MISVAVMGGRGYTGSELLPLLWAHPDVELKAVASRSAAGNLVADVIPGLKGCNLNFCNLIPDEVGNLNADAYILALPNGASQPWVDAIDASDPNALIIDLGADYRFNEQWVYGQPEWFASKISGSRRIANPGCYATAMMLALQPLVGVLDGDPVAFGVSGFSGAGRSPSRRNDPGVLKDNLLPYALTDHIHEREVTRHLNQKVRFMPHVASFFRGISMSVPATLAEPVDEEWLFDRFQRSYDSSDLVEVQTGIPEVATVAGTHKAIIGGFSVSRESPAEISLISVLDNLLKGAATQVVQNLNLAFGLESCKGLKI